MLFKYSKEIHHAAFQKFISIETYSFMGYLLGQVFYERFFTMEEVCFAWDHLPCHFHNENYCCFYLFSSLLFSEVLGVALKTSLLKVSIQKLIVKIQVNFHFTEFPCTNIVTLSGFTLY